MLAIQRFGEDKPGLPLVIVHGLFGSGRNWGAIARRLALMQPVVTLDQRNHGDSPRFATQSYADMAGDVAEVIETLGGRADIMGHSMGGKTAMQLALTRPGLLNRMIVADIAPVAYGHDQTPYITAMRGLDLTGLTSRSEAERRLSETVDDPALRAFFLQSLDLTGDTPRWKLNLDVLQEAMPQMVGWPGTQGRFDGPTLFLSGANSPYVLPEHRTMIQGLFPHARFARLPGAGHWLHADKPREFIAAVTTWLEKTA